MINNKHLNFAFVKYMNKALLFIFFIFFCLSVTGAKINLEAYDLSILKSDLNTRNSQYYDSLLNHTFRDAQQHVSYTIIKPLVHHNHSIEFYLLILLTMFLGLIRAIQPGFLNENWRAFINPTLGNRQLKEVIQSAAFPNLLLTTFSIVIFGLYMYYVVSMQPGWFFANWSKVLIVGLFAVFALIIFALKFLLFKLFYWAIDQGQNSELYLYNVFLSQKILGLFLLPIIAFLAFSVIKIKMIVLYISLTVIALLYIRRYILAWKFHEFILRNNKLNFFMYLCTLELLPLAIIIKVLMLSF